MISLDTSILLSYYQAKSGAAVAGSGGSAATGSKTGVGGTAAPTAPWSSLSKAPKADDLINDFSKAAEKSRKNTSARFAAKWTAHDGEK